MMMGHKGLALAAPSQGVVSLRCSTYALAHRTPHLTHTPFLRTARRELVSVHAGNGYSGYDGGKYPQVPPASGTWGEEQQQQQPYPPYPQPPQQDQGRRNPYLGMSEQEAYDQELLHKSSVTTKNLSFVAFWLQFALSVVSAGILLFSVAFVSRGYNTTSAVDASKYLTLVGVIAAFISSLMAHGFLTMSRRVQEGKTVAKNYLVNSLLTNNAISLAGIGITVIGLQVSVGTLVAKSLATSVSGQFAAQNANQLVSLDVFALQASTNTLLCHVIGLLFTNLMLRIVNKPRKEPKPA